MDWPTNRGPFANSMHAVPYTPEIGGPTVVAEGSFAFAQALIASRRNVSPQRLVEPGPGATQLESLLDLAAAAPDHGLLTPWRFVVVPPSKRNRLAEVFALSLMDREPDATPAQIDSAKEKAHLAPVLLIAIARLGSLEPNIPALERIVSLGAAIQNLLLGAHAMGYGSGLTSGPAMASPRMRRLLSLGEAEKAVCCINLGTIAKASTGRLRPAPSSFASTLSGLPSQSQDGSPP